MHLAVKALKRYPGPSGPQPASPYASLNSLCSQVLGPFIHRSCFACEVMLNSLWVLTSNKYPTHRCWGPSSTARWSSC